MSARREVRGDPRPWGETTCGYGKATPQCDRTATRHFAWLDTMETANACDEHAEFIRETTAVDVDEHTFGGNCGMPGTLWHHPYEDEPEGYCLFPANDDAAVLVEVYEPVTAVLSGSGAAAEGVDSS